MATATWNGVVIAQSDQFETTEGHIYFPVDAVKNEYLVESDTTTVCPWKGTCRYLTVDVNGKRNADAAWYYSDPEPAASSIKDHIAFWRGVDVET